MLLFEQIKEITGGYLQEKVYEKMYLTALDSPEGDFIDVGCAQGASTISLALALKKRNSNYKVYSIDRFNQSAALLFFDSVEKNVEQLNINLEKFLLKDYVKIIIVGRDIVPNRKKIGFIFLDADGAIDRDFKRYYNNLQEGGIIVIDDYEKIFNIQTKTRFLKWQNEKQINSYLKNQNLSSLFEYTPLGKQYTIYKMVTFLINQGYIEVIEILDGTLFAKKTKKIEYNEKTDLELHNIRKEILNEYNWRHKKVIQEYRKLHKSFSMLSQYSSCDRIIAYEKYNYSVKKEERFTKVYEWDKEEQFLIEDDYIIQDIWYSDYKEIKDKLDTKGECLIDVSCMQGKRIKDFLEKEKIIKLSIYSIIIKENIIGAIVFLYSEGGKFWENKEKIRKIHENISLDFVVLQKEVEPYLSL